MILFPHGPIHEIHTQFLHGKTNKAMGDLNQFLQQETITQEEKLTASALQAFYLIFTGKVTESKNLLKTTLDTALEAELWLQGAYAYLVAAEIEIRTGHFDQCGIKAKQAREVLQKRQKRNDVSRSSQENILVQILSYHYQIRALVEQYMLWGPIFLMLDLVVSNQEKFETTIQNAEILYQKAVQLNQQLQNPYVEVLLLSNRAWFLSLKYTTLLGDYPYSDAFLTEPQKKEVMAVYFQWYSTAKATRFQWQVARFFQYGFWPKVMYTAYGYEIQEIKQWPSDWNKQACKPFRQVEDALWTKWHAFYYYYRLEYEGNFDHLIKIFNENLKKIEQLQNYHVYLQGLYQFSNHLLYNFFTLRSYELAQKLRQKLLQINHEHNVMHPELLSCDILFREGIHKIKQGDYLECIQILQKPLF